MSERKRLHANVNLAWGAACAAAEILAPCPLSAPSISAFDGPNQVEVTSGQGRSFALRRLREE